MSSINQTERITNLRSVMKALLISVGSRGDAEPFCSLAQELLSAGHDVELFVQPEHETLIPKGCYDNDGDQHLHLTKLPFTQQEFYKFSGPPSHGADHSNPRVKFIGKVTDIIAALVFPHAKDVLETAMSQKVDVIVCSALTRPLALAVGEKLNLPVVIVHLQPLMPTEWFPHYSQTENCVNAILALHHQGSNGENNKSTNSTYGPTNLQSYWELEQFQHEFLQERQDEMYKSLGLDEDKLMTFDQLKVILSGNHERVHITNCFSQAIIPNHGFSNNNIHDIGPLADLYIQPDFESPADLQAFLADCDNPPICIGYGSMPFDKVQLIIETMEQLGEKAIFVMGAAISIPDSDGNSIFQISSVPYPWLLPQCRMMFCHGGAGVVNACLRAGIPIITSPLMGDQFFHAVLLERMGVGYQAGTMATLSKEDLLKGVEAGNKCHEKAKVLGERARQFPNGVVEMQKMLEKITNF